MRKPAKCETRILRSALRSPPWAPILRSMHRKSASLWMRASAATLFAMGVLASSSCGRRPPPASDQAPDQSPAQQPTARPSATPSPVPATPIAALHHAAQEMALDGFQYDKKSHAWPFDAGVTSASDYLALLVRNNYLSPSDAARFTGVLVSNLSDSDPGETAFVRTAPGTVPIVVVRKDGRIQSVATPADCDAVAPPPPREPAWLP